jgi:hypothetical protein
VVSEEKPWEKPPEEPSYLWEMLRHQYTLYGFLGSLATGSLLALPYDLGVAALPLVGFAGITALAALFVPSSATFRYRVNQRRKAERRAQSRDHLLHELSGRVETGHPNFGIYERMVEHTNTLRTVARRQRSSFGIDDVERLEDAAVDYLGLWLSRMSMAERRKRLVEQNLEHKIETTQRRLEKATGEEKKPLEKALEELERLLRSRRRIEAHETAVDAALIAMPDAFDEVYQGVMQNPTSSDAAQRLKQAVDRMRVEDELSAAVDADLESLFKGSSTSSASPQSAAARARRQSA